MFPDCRDREELKRAAEAALRGAIPARKLRIFLFHEVPESALFQSNPVWAGLQRDQSALHEAMVVDAATWQQHCPRADHGHVLVGPVVARSTLIGAVALTRENADPAFTTRDLTTMNRVCLHFSTRWGELPERAAALTPREHDVCQAVCRGLRNAEAARELGLSEHTIKQNLKAIFRKLQVRSRAELVARTGGRS